MLLPETLKLHDTSRFEFHYIYFLPWKNQMETAISEAGGQVICYPAKNNIELIFKSKKVEKYCEEHQIDLIHCHLPWAGFLGRRVHQQLGIPVIYTEHNLQERYHPATKFINKWTFNFQNLAIGVSEDVSRSIKEHIDPSIAVKTLLNGVNTESFQRTGDPSVRKSLGIPYDAIVIGNVAVFRFQKRLKEWLQVVGELVKNNSDVYGILVGAGPLEKGVMDELERLELQDRIILPGLQTNVKPYFEAMDIFMMSSAFEGLPIALLESMSMECAVVATNAGGIKEVIRNTEDGLSCEVSEWKQLSGLCQELIQDRQLLQNYKIAARKRVVDAFSLEKLVGELEKEYETIHAESAIRKLEGAI